MTWIQDGNTKQRNWIVDCVLLHWWSWYEHCLKGGNNQEERQSVSQSAWSVTLVRWFKKGNKMYKKITCAFCFVISTFIIAVVIYLLLTEWQIFSDRPPKIQGMWAISLLTLLSKYKTLRKLDGLIWLYFCSLMSSSRASHLSSERLHRRRKTSSQNTRLRLRP